MAIAPKFNQIAKKIIGIFSGLITIQYLVTIVVALHSLATKKFFRE
jgi:hypothetical protein